MEASKRNRYKITSILIVLAMTFCMIAEPMVVQGVYGETGTAVQEDTSAQLKVENLKADGNSASTVNCDVKKITGTIKIETVNENKWYFKDSLGNKNQLDTLELGGAFEGFGYEVEVNKSKPNTADFTINVNNRPIKANAGHGTIAVSKDNNCSNRDLAERIEINNVHLDTMDTPKGILDDPEADSPSYTVRVKIDGGYVADGLTKSDISYDGAFEEATTVSVKTAADKKSFTAKLSKPVDKDPNRITQGHLIIDANKIKYDNGDTYSLDLKLSMSDIYIPKVVTGGSSKEDLSVNGVQIAQEILEQTLTVATDILEYATNKGAWSAFGYVNVAFSIAKELFLEDKGEDPTTKALREIQEKLNNMSCQIDTATTEILGSIEKSDLNDQLKDVKKSASDLVRSQYGFYNDQMQQAAAWIKAGNADKHLATIKKSMQAVYNSENHHFDYLNKFNTFSDLVTGNNKVLQNKDIFEVYKAIAAYTYDYNAQTLDERRAFAQSISDLYAEGYGVLLMAITYDYDANKKQKEAIDDAVKSLQEKIDGDSLNPSDVKRIKKAISDYKDTAENCENNMKQSEKQRKSLIADKEKADTAYKASIDKINAERTEIYGGAKKVYAYRINKYINRYMTTQTTSYASQNDFSSVLSAAEIETLRLAAKYRKTTLYNDLKNADFLIEHKLTYKGAVPGLIKSTATHKYSISGSAEAAAAYNGIWVSRSYEFHGPSFALFKRQKYQYYVKAVNLSSNEYDKIRGHEHQNGSRLIKLAPNYDDNKEVLFLNKYDGGTDKDGITETKNVLNTYTYK